MGRGDGKWKVGRTGERVAIKSAPRNSRQRRRTATPLPSGSLCVIQGIDPRSFLNALFRPFSPFLPRVGGLLRATGPKKARRLARRAATSRAFLPACVRVTRPSLRACAGDVDPLLPIKSTVYRDNNPVAAIRAAVPRNFPPARAKSFHLRLLEKLPPLSRCRRKMCVYACACVYTYTYTCVCRAREEPLFNVQFYSVFR